MATGKGLGSKEHLALGQATPAPLGLSLCHLLLHEGLLNDLSFHILQFLPESTNKSCEEAPDATMPGRPASSQGLIGLIA